MIRSTKKNKFIQPLWLLQINSFYKDKKFFSNILKNLKVLKFLIRYIKFHKYVQSKKRIFIFNTLVITLLSLISILPKSVLSRRLYFFLNLCYAYLVTFRYMHFNYNKRLFRSRFFMFNFLSKFILFSLKKVSFLPTDNKLILRYYGLHQKNVNARFLLNYIIVKLGQYFVLNQILNPILKRLKALSYVKGFRIIVSGRLTRAERAALHVKSYKKMPLSSYNQRVDYAADFKVMKFGVVGIKVYLLYDITPPYYYFFEFRNKL